MADFLDEVKEDLKRERFEKIVKTYGKFVATAIIVVIAGTAFSSWYSGYLVEQEIASGDKYRKAIDLSSSDSSKAITLLDQIYADGTSGYGQLAGLKKASLLASEGKYVDAIEQYNMIAEDQSYDLTVRDLSVILSSYLMIEEEKIDQGAYEKLKPLAENNRPWRYSAKELLGIYSLRLGQKEEAHNIFNELINDQFAPAALRNRAKKMLQ